MTKIQIENVIQPGSTYTVNAEKYEAMRQAYLKVVPASPPGLTPADILTQAKQHLPEDVFPGGAKAGWWAKAVQLDLEAKGVIKRMKGSPVRLYRA